MKYAGADWLKSNMKFLKPDMTTVSELGCKVADLLGELYAGIYHLDNKTIEKVEWNNKSYIQVTIGWKDWSTFDFDILTRLVFLAHHMAIRVDLTPVKYQYMRLLFHQRNRSGDIFHRHPTLDEAVASFKATVNLSEYAGE